MRAISRTITYFVLDWLELDETERHLVFNAARVRLNAQAKYSDYWVGASLASKTGRFYSGCNTRTTHAVESAINQMTATEGREESKISKIFMVGAFGGNRIKIPPFADKDKWLSFSDMCVPCGHCLQVIWENCHADTRVKIFSILPNGQIGRITIDDALSLRSSPKDLAVKY